MAVTVTWYAGNDLSTAVGAGQAIGLYGSEFYSTINLGTYQGTTTVTNTSGSVNYGGLPNVQYLGDLATANWGGGEDLVTNISFSECTFRIRVTSPTPVRLQGSKIYASGSTIGTNINLAGFEWGDSAWTIMSSGISTPLTLSPHITSGSCVHDYFVAISESPINVGIHSGSKLVFYTEWY